MEVRVVEYGDQVKVCVGGGGTRCVLIGRMERCVGRVSLMTLGV